MRGTQNQFLFLPDQHSDFPFAGLRRGLGLRRLPRARRALRVPRPVGDPHRGDRRRIASAPCSRSASAALIFWHAFFNLGMVTGILPVVGVTLPLFSYGGSSVLTVMIGLGLLMNVSVRRHQVAPR